MADPGSRPLAHPIDCLVGDSPAMRALRAQIRHLAAFDGLGHAAVPTLLLQGETGTGKGLLARVIHDSGPRAHGPFVEVNCAALPEPLLEAELFGFAAGAFTDAKRAKPGLLEAASGGTLFLDEIDSLPLLLQSKLLNALEAKQVRRLGTVTEQRVDVKYIAAVQEELGLTAAAGHFRADLYYRLAVVILALPPLRERGEDVLVLAQHFLHGYTEVHGLPSKHLTAAARAWLHSYDWPGNVRELRYLLERVMLLHPGASIGPKTLQRLCLPRPPPSAQGAPVLARLGEIGHGEPEQIRQALVQTGGNVVRAARLLGLSRKALRYRMGQYAIARPRLEQEMAPGEVQAEGAAARHSTGKPLAQTGETATPALAWERQSVVVLAIELTWPTSVSHAFYAGAHPSPSAAPWTVATHWQHVIVEQVQECGGVLLAGTPALLTVIFGTSQTLAYLLQQAVQAALTVQHMVEEARALTGGAAVPAVRLALHWGGAAGGDAGERPHGAGAGHGGDAGAAGALVGAGRTGGCPGVACNGAPGTGVVHVTAVRGQTA
jgi:DNA-binding NtrC family response regulator